MPNVDEIRELLKNMSNEQKLELIRLCNIENNKTKESITLLKLKNNYHCHYCHSNDIYKTDILVNHNNLDAITATKTILYSSKTNTIFFTQKKNNRITARIY